MSHRRGRSRDLEANRPRHSRSRPRRRHRTYLNEYQWEDQELQKQITGIDGEQVQSIAILSFRGLQLYRIAQLQAELLDKQNSKLGDRDRRDLNKIDDQKEGKEIDELIQRYADAVRNYETLAQTIEFDENHTYEFLGGERVINIFKKRNRDSVNKNRATVNIEESYGPFGFRELDKGRQSQRLLVERIRSRLHMAIFGGVALIAPVIYMTLKPTPTGNLIAASVSTAIFAIILVLFASDASGKDVLASTAAYAAVMVVFIGASSSTGT